MCKPRKRDFALRYLLAALLAAQCLLAMGSAVLAPGAHANGLTAQLIALHDGGLELELRDVEGLDGDDAVTKSIERTDLSAGTVSVTGNPTGQAHRTTDHAQARAPPARP